MPGELSDEEKTAYLRIAVALELFDDFDERIGKLNINDEDVDEDEEELDDDEAFWREVDRRVDEAKERKAETGSYWK